MICQVSPACSSEMKQWQGPYFGSFLISLPPTHCLSPSIVTTRLCVSRKYWSWPLGPAFVSNLHNGEINNTHTYQATHWISEATKRSSTGGHAICIPFEICFSLVSKPPYYYFSTFLPLIFRQFWFYSYLKKIEVTIFFSTKHAIYRSL